MCYKTKCLLLSRVAGPGFFGLYISNNEKELQCGKLQTFSFQFSQQFVCKFLAYNEISKFKSGMFLQQLSELVSKFFMVD